MKRLKFMIVFVVLSTSLHSQITVDGPLAEKLKDKEKLEEMKKEVFDHYQELKNRLDKSDSTQIKHIKKQLKHWNRKFWIDEFYTNENGIAQSKEIVDFYSSKLVEKLKSKASTRSQNKDWELVGPTNVTSYDGIGRCDKLAFHPTNANIMLAGSSNGGLYKTVDAGDNWTCLTEFLPSLGVAGIAIHPTNPDTIYFLSGDSNGVSWSSYRAPSLGLFKSINGGLTWDLISFTSDAFTSRDLLMDPNNPSTLMVATSIGIFRTTDDGNTWNQTISNSVRDIEFKPNDPTIVYAANNENFYKSINGGVSFLEITIPDLTNQGGNRIVIGTSSDNPSRVYLFSGPTIDDDGDDEPDRFQGFFSSNDSGNSFTRVTQTPVLFVAYNGIGPDVLSDQSNYNIAIAVNPLDENEIYVGGLICWHSTDGGVTWEEISNYWSIQFDYMHPDIHELKFNPLNNKLFVANDGGIYRLDNDDDWIGLHNGLSCSTFYRFELENQDNNVWGGSQDNGFLEDEGGGEFSEYKSGDGFDSITDHDHNVADGESNDMYFSINSSIYCEGLLCDISIPNNDIFNAFFAYLAMSPISEDKIYAGYWHGFYKSDNAGSDWDSLSNKPANWAVSSCFSNDDVAYIAGSADWHDAPGSRFNKFTAPSTWNDYTSSLVTAGYDINLRISDIDVDPDDHDQVYISVAGTQANTKIFYTNNGGTSWQNLSYDLPNIPFFSIKIDESNGIYAGSNAGVFYKSAGQNFWHYFANNLPPVPVTEIELSPGGGPYTEVYISTYGRGIWKTDTFGTCPSNRTLVNTIESKYIYEAGNEIISTQSLLGNEADLKLNTGNRIILQSGFHAPKGTFFRTYTSGCGAEIE